MVWISRSILGASAQCLLTWDDFRVPFHMQDDNLSTSVCRHFALRPPLSLIWSNCRSSYLVFLCVWFCKNLIRQTHYDKKIRFKVKCVYFSPGNALGPPIGLHQMKISWWEQDICSLSARSPLAADWSALAHLLFFLYRPVCTSVLCLCAPHAYLCVIGLSEMEKAGWGLSWVEGVEEGCLHSGKTSRGFPLRALTFHGGEASRPPPSGGREVTPSRRNTSKNPRPPRTSARVSGTEGLPQFSARSQRCESTEVCEGARGRPSLRHVASSGTEVFVQRAGEGRQERRRRDDTLSRECLPLHGLVQSTRFGLKMTFSQVQPSKKKNKRTKQNKRWTCMQIWIAVPFSETYSLPVPIASK